MQNTFISIDTETANPNMSSICQIGVAVFCSGEITHTWETLVNPQDYFSEFNTLVHGITQESVQSAPTFPQIAQQLHHLLHGHTVISHTAFDRTAIHRTYSKHQLQHPESQWIDSAKVARRAWTQFAERGYGLSNLAEFLGIEFKHHNALEDAITAGKVFNASLIATNTTIDQISQLAKRPIVRTETTANLTPNPEGPLADEVVVFTGSLHLPRADAATLAANLGCTVATGVTKKTTLLVVGDQDITKLAGKDKSSKHLKTEELIAKGHPIRILSESDFMAFLQ